MSDRENSETTLPISGNDARVPFFEKQINKNGSPLRIILRDKQLDFMKHSERFR